MCGVVVIRPFPGPHVEIADAGRLAQRGTGSRLPTCDDLQVPVIPLRSARRHPYLMEQTAAGRRCVAKGWIHAPKVPVSSARRPRIHGASGGPEAPPGNSRMAVAARASPRGALHCAGRPGSGTAGRTRAPTIRTHAVDGSQDPLLGSALLASAGIEFPIAMLTLSRTRLAFP